MPRDARRPSPIRLHAGANLLRSTNRRIDPATCFRAVRTERAHEADTLDLDRETRERRRASISRATHRRALARHPLRMTMLSPSLASGLPSAIRVIGAPRFENPFDICPMLVTPEDHGLDDREFDDVMRSLGIEPNGP